MDKLTGFFRHANVWSVSVPLLILYCVAVGLFFSLGSVDRALTSRLKAAVNGGKPAAQLAVFGLSAVFNAVGVWALVFLCGRLDAVPRLAMVGFPLLLLLEEHIRAGRADKERRRLELLLAAGMAAGIVGAALALMRGCPIG